MGLTLEQLKKYTVGVLSNWLKNKPTLDKISESEDGTLLFNGSAIQGGNGLTIEGNIGRTQTLIFEGEDVHHGDIITLMQPVTDFDALAVFFYYPGGWFGIATVKSFYVLIDKDSDVGILVNTSGTPDGVDAVYLFKQDTNQYEIRHYHANVSSVAFGAKIYGIKYQEAKVGRKIYPLTDKQYNIPNDFPIILSDSIKNYDEIMVRYHVGCHSIPTEFIEYGTNNWAFEIVPATGSGYETLLYFDDEYTLRAYQGSQKASGIFIKGVYGVRYETVTEGPVTDAQVEQAKTETIEELSAEKSQ